MKVGIAFGGGGARGLAHISIIEALEELGIKPSVISGASIGAIIGAFYAAGFSSAEMKQILKKLLYPKSNKFYDLLFKSDIIKALTMFDPEFIKSGLVKGDKLQNVLQSELKIDSFEGLKTPLKLVAADLYTKEEVIFDTGKLSPKMRASYSLPGLFTPVEINGRVLIDGGTVNPVPYDILMNECDITIAIDVTTPAKPNGKESTSAFDAVFAAYQIMQYSINQQKMRFKKPDIYIKPDIHNVRLLEFSKDQVIFNHAQNAKEELKHRLEVIIESRINTGLS